MIRFSDKMTASIAFSRQSLDGAIAREYIQLQNVTRFYPAIA
jgi:hypothetical protein